MFAVEVSDLYKRYGSSYTAINHISFEIEPSTILTLLGPSGCGKSTTLRCIAGLETCTGGDIKINGKLVSSAAMNLMIPSERRSLGMVPQSYGIWPHMTVAENVAFGLRVRRVAKAEITTRVRQALRLVQLEGLEDRYGTELSGGQQQRVALARCIVYDPAVILLDEPLSNLDAKLRESTRLELLELQRRLGITMLYVTHDQQEALMVSNTMAVMNAGRIEQIGKPSEIYSYPRTKFVAEFIGQSNFLKGRLIQQKGTDGAVLLEDARTQLTCRLSGNIPVGADVLLAVKAEDLKEIGELDGSGQEGTFPAVIKSRTFVGSFHEIRAQFNSSELVVYSSVSAGKQPGEIAFFRSAAGAPIAFPAPSENDINPGRGRP